MCQFEAARSINTTDRENNPIGCEVQRFVLGFSQESTFAVLGCVPSFVACFRRKICKLEPDGESLLKSVVGDVALSARNKKLHIGRVIAGLEPSDKIMARHLSEAINYRTFDRNSTSRGS